MTYPAQTHYFSPFTSLAVLLVVLGLRSLASLFGQRAMKLVYVLIAIQLLINMLSISVKPSNWVSQSTLAQGQGTGIDHSYTREQFKNVLMQKGGKHLVLVSYAPNQVFHNEWVFNNADIDKGPVVWARSMNEEDDAKLIAYFKDRLVWRITVNREHRPHKLYDQR